MSRLNVSVASTSPVPSEPLDFTGSSGCVLLGLPVMEIVAAGFCVVKYVATASPPES